jgi:hypothetical protein
LAAHCAGPGWDLWWSNLHWGRYSPSTSVFHKLVHHRLSSGAGPIGHIMADVSSHPIIKKKTGDYLPFLRCEAAKHETLFTDIIRPMSPWIIIGKTAPFELQPFLDAARFDPVFTSLDFTAVLFHRARTSALRLTPNQEDQVPVFTSLSDRMT